MRINRNPSKLKVGMWVTSDFNYEDRMVPMQIIRISDDAPTYASGLSVSARAKPCVDCGRYHHQVIGVDAGWFIPMKEQP